MSYTIISKSKHVCEVPHTWDVPVGSVVLCDWCGVYRILERGFTGKRRWRPMHPVEIAALK